MHRGSYLRTMRRGTGRPRSCACPPFRVTSGSVPCRVDTRMLPPPQHLESPLSSGKSTTCMGILYGFKDLRIENGSCQGNSLASTGLLVFLFARHRSRRKAQSAEAASRHWIWGQIRPHEGYAPVDPHLDVSKGVRDFWPLTEYRVTSLLRSAPQ